MMGIGIWIVNLSAKTGLGREERVLSIFVEWGDLLRSGRKTYKDPVVYNCLAICTFKIHADNLAKGCYSPLEHCI